MNTKLPLSSYVLIAANLIPLIGVLFYDWDAILVLALFWIENLIIGVFNIFRIGVAGVVQKDKSAFFMVPFFVVHYGIFCSAHGMILAELIGYPKVDYTQYFPEISSGLFEIFLEGGPYYCPSLKTLPQRFGWVSLRLCLVDSFLLSKILF